MILSLLIALKFHWSSKNNILVSLVSLIAIISITIGISISIISLSVMNGFKYELSRRILSIIPHGEIQPVNVSFIDWKKTLNRIQKMPHVINANPYVNFPGIIEYNNKWHVVYVKSIVLIQNLHVNGLLNFIEKNTWKYFCEYKEQIILGKGVADALNIKTSDWITVIITHDFYEKKNILSSKKIRLQVSGILNSNSQLDYNIAIISLSDAQDYCNMTLDTIEGIAVTLDDIFCADQIMQNIKSTLNENVNVRSWMNTHGYIYRDIQMVRLIIYLSMILIMVISCFNVISTLILSIRDKNYNIAIFRALGASNILIQRVFFLYGLIIYFISGLMGTGLGIFVSANLANFIKKYNDFLDKKILSEGIYFIDFLPIKISGWDIFLVLGFTLLLGSCTSWYATVRIRKINFTQILK